MKDIYASGLAGRYSLFLETEHNQGAGASGPPVQHRPPKARPNNTEHPFRLWAVVVVAGSIVSYFIGCEVLAGFLRLLDAF